MKKENGNDSVIRTQKRNRQIIVLLILFGSLNLIIGGLTYHSYDSSSNNFCFVLSLSFLAMAVIPYIDKRKKSNRLGAVVFFGLIYMLICLLLYRWIPTLWWGALACIEISICSIVSYFYQKNECDLRLMMAYILSVEKKEQAEE